MREILLVGISGEDQPGVTAAVAAALAEFDAKVLDIGQSVIHDTLSLGLLVELPETRASGGLRARIQSCAAGLGLRARFSPIDEASYERWVLGQGLPRYVVTLLARKITAAQLAPISGMLADHGLNIDGVTRLSGRVPLGERAAPARAAVEFSARGELGDAPGFRRRLLELASELDVDISLQEDNKYRRNRRLVAFDMDSTLIETEVIDELAARAGVGEEVARLTERAMRGELDFAEALARRVALLEGLDERVLEDVARRLPLTEGAEHLVGTLKSLGYKTAILSGGFGYFGRHLQERLGIDHLHANELEMEAGRLTGRVREPIVDGARKAALLAELARGEGIDLQQVISVGDGANDLPMLSIAGLGIAFRAKPLVKRSAEQSISTLGLDGILYLLGIGDSHQREGAASGRE